MRPRAELDGLAPTVHGGAPSAAGTLLDFSVSTNPLGPSPRTRAAAARAAIGRYPERDSATLRGALATALEVAAEQLVVGNGSVELFWLVALSYLQRGDRALVVGPTFAEYARARQDKLARKPATLTFDQAAVVAVSGVTALQGLRDAGRIESGQHVLIIGASGGVGTYAVQIAKAFGAQVTGVCSTAKTDLVRSIGADHVVDYTHDDFADGSRRYDLILDLAGNTPLSRLRRALTPAGTLVIASGEDGGRWTGGMGRQMRALALSPFVCQRLTMLVSKQDHADLERLAQLIETGELTPVIGKTYPLDQTPDAMRDLLAGHARGKLVITVPDAG